MQISTYFSKLLQKQDPAQFLQISGRSTKLHIDHNEPPNTMMPWQGNSEVLIDRFDVRAHLDYIQDVKNIEGSFEEEAKDMRPLNYERYRILIQNSFLKGTKIFFHLKNKQKHLRKWIGN